MNIKGKIWLIFLAVVMLGSTALPILAASSSICYGCYYCAYCNDCGDCYYCPYCTNCDYYNCECITDDDEAFTSVFYDVSDKQLASYTLLLNSLNIIGGYPDGTFKPEKAVTRAEFSKMAIYLLGIEDKVRSASQRTIFSDVTSSHWAAGYVNLAYENGLIRGYGDGTFRPDNELSYAEILTILLRVLDYTDDDIGKVYPDDYISFADDIGLTKDIYNTANATVSREKCARLLISALEAQNRSGKELYKKLYPHSVGDVIILDTDTTSDTGKKHSLKLYEGGKATWYQKSGTVDAYLTEAHGIALIDDSGQALGFIPDAEKYTLVDGILLINSRRSDGGALTYEAVMYSGGEQAVYPRVASISSNLVGSSGTMILDENGYATAFISDDTDTYTVTKDAILIGVASSSATFYINNKQTEYEFASKEAVISESVGESGIVLTNEDGELYAFVSDGVGEYTALACTLMEVDGSVATLLVNGMFTAAYRISGTVNSAQAGQSGTALLNANGYIEVFISDGTSGKVVSNAVFLGVGYTGNYFASYEATFYVNGKAETYPIGYVYSLIYSLSSYSVGASGTLVLDENGYVTSFTRDGGAYTITSGRLISASSSKATFLINGTTVEYRVSGNISSSLTGQAGTVLIDSSGKVTAFIADVDSDSVTPSQSGIIVHTGALADDGKTVVIKIYENGKLQKYRATAALSTSYKGTMGRLMLDEDNTVVGFIEETANCTLVTVTSADASTLVHASGKYTIDKSVTVIFNGAVTSWESVCADADGKTATIFFDTLGSISVIFFS